VVDPPEDAELVLVAARRAPLAGIVVDPDDNPIEGAELELVLATSAALCCASSIVRATSACEPARAPMDASRFRTRR
jgi:hypothetical protein